MKVALDISPLTSTHSTRGIGSYTKSLLNSLKKEKGIELITFEDSKDPPQADVIHHPFFDLFFNTLPLGKKGKTVITVHDVIPLVFPAFFPTGPKAHINLFFQKLSLKKADGIICDSKTSKVDIENKLAIPKDRIHVVYLAQDKIFRSINNQKELSIVKQKFSLPDKFALYVGDVNWNKNVMNLIEALKFTEIPLVMVGKAIKEDMTDQSREIDEKIRALNFQQRVIKTGYVTNKELCAIYNLASVTVLPSYYEGFGLPVLESMACSTPVVCSNNSSLLEIGKDTAIFCDPADPVNIAQKINTVLNLESTNYTLLKKKSLIHAKAFTSEKVAKETIKVYKSALGIRNVVASSKQLL